MTPENYKNNFNYSYGRNTKVSGKISNFDEKIFDTNKENIIIKNDSILFNDNYLSISDNSIISEVNGSYIQNNTLQNQEIEESYYDINNISQVLLRKNYYIFYFEIHYLMLWNSDYIKTVYPENNLIALLKVNDDFDTQEKILLVKSEEKSKFIPLLKKIDVEKVIIIN